VPTYPRETVAFIDFRKNLNYANQLVAGGRHLAALRVGKFDVDDLYRAAWVQAVGALDHWIHQEIYARAVALAQQPSAPKPPGFLNFSIPMSLFEGVHHGDESLDLALRKHMVTALGWKSYQDPGKIAEGFRIVSDIKLWRTTAAVLNEQSPQGNPFTEDAIKEKLTLIVKRRNKIAHEADRDPANPAEKHTITDEETLQVIEWVESVAAAILVALDRAPSEA
jgi:hypothetical protein